MRAYRVAYDGRPYRGFQRQPDVPTVEDALLDALRALSIDPVPPSGWAAAGRTDAGVSAVAQTVAFEAPDWLSPPAFNSELPGTVRVWASSSAPAGFHATHDASRREYTYVLRAPDADADRLRAALDRLSGRHDFHNLTPDDAGTVRELDASLTRADSTVLLAFRAGGFPRQLVRRAVSLVAAVARGEAGFDRIDRVLGAEPVDGPDGVAPAPAYPLVLTDVSYGLGFERDAEAAASTRAIFEEIRAECVTRARVAATVLDGL